MIARQVSLDAGAVAVGRSLAADGVQVPTVDMLRRAFDAGLSALTFAEGQADRMEDALYDRESGVGR